MFWAYWVAVFWDSPDMETRLTARMAPITVLPYAAWRWWTGDRKAFLKEAGGDQ